MALLVLAGDPFALLIAQQKVKRNKLNYDCNDFFPYSLRAAGHCRCNAVSFFPIINDD